MKQQAIITGAGSGIGLACVQKFLAAGWMVDAHYHSSDNALKRLSKKYGNALKCFKADFSDEASLKSFLEHIRNIRADALVNNAAIYDLSQGGRNRVADAQKIFMINTIVPILIAEVVFEEMKIKRKGAIVNISSIAAKYGSNGTEIFYGASKRGLEALTRTLSRQGATNGICVNTVRPGAIDTDFHKKIGRSDQQLVERRKRIPMQRLGKPQEIADMVFHLCAHNTFATNQTITVAGGD
ncbi:MAG: SDR family oxidoreductase [Candidatus Omnitrophica bacterium]|nr:SDR family oxidoreductase [Candidatus Omnitrophota bacterium]